MKSSSSEIEYVIPPYRIPVVKVGDKVVEGELLTDGSADISEVFKYGGKDKVEEYIIREINKVYELQSASISRKHTEIIVRQMFSRKRIKEAGETNFSIGDIVENTAFIEENNRMKALSNIEAKAETIVLGITEVSLRTKSYFLRLLSKTQIVCLLKTLLKEELILYVDLKKKCYYRSLDSCGNRL